MFNDNIISNRLHEHHSNRYFKIRYNFVEKGVQQGSILGISLFIIILHWSTDQQYGDRIIIYADNTNILLARNHFSSH